MISNKNEITAYWDKDMFGKQTINLRIMLLCNKKLM